MNQTQQPESPLDLMHLLERIDEAANDAQRLSTGRVLEAVGRRSFGPLLLVPGLVTLAPIIGDIPGVPTLMGLLVILVALQLLVGRKNFWLPQWMLKRSVSQHKVKRVIRWLKPVARFLDRLSKPRLTRLTQGVGAYAAALACIAIAAAMPPMEFVPFSANLAGAALTLLGLALIAHDGLLALLGLVLTFGSLIFVASSLL